jgi:imidazolonepropionase-like amidohydrolase
VDEEFLSLARAAGTVYCPTLTVRSGYLRLAEAVLARRAPEADDPNDCRDGGTRKRLEATASLDARMVDASRLEARRARAAGAAEAGRANLKRVHEAGLPVAMGTDAGNPLTLHGPSVYAEMEAMQAAGLSPVQVLVASTSGGARAMGMDKEIGTLEEGKAADLLVLGADPTVDVANMRRLRHVMRGGVLRSVAELSAVAR